MLKPEIIFEDNDVLVINKPAGLIVHSDGRTEEYSVAEWVLENYPEMKDVGEPWTSPQGEIVNRPGIVHRLDRTTSGVMILAKTKDAHAFLKQQFQDRTTEKIYTAFVYGNLKADSGVIEKEIVRIKSVPPRWGVARDGEDNKKREAVTHWQVLSRGVDPATKESVSILSVSPKTGRTHQIRVHLKAIGYPIVSDHLYAAGKPEVLGFKRPALHASKLSITLPRGEKRSFEASMPADMGHAMAQIQGFAENA
jgi:23S rRNA pseudouridine1911/1915/1917 synthase